MVSLKSRNGGEAWTAAEVGTLMTMVAEGKSSGDIAKVLTRHTRNSVIGKTSRLGLKTRGRVAKVPKVAQPRPLKIAPVPSSKPLPQPKSVGDVRWVPEEDHKSWMCLCRGDSGLCSNPRVEVDLRGRRFLSSWCQPHREVFTVSDTPRRKRP